MTAGSNQTACGQTIVCELATYFMVQGYLPEIRNSKWAVAGGCPGLVIHQTSPIPKEYALPLSGMVTKDLNMRVQMAGLK